MSAQPGFQSGGFAAGQYLDSLTGLGVDDDRGVAVAAPQGEVVDPITRGIRTSGKGTRRSSRRAEAYDTGTPEIGRVGRTPGRITP
jgi:hypothetical protein